MNSAKLNKLEKIILKAYGDHLKTNRKKSWIQKLENAGITVVNGNGRLATEYDFSEDDVISMVFCLGSLRIPAQIAERIIVLGFLP